MKTDDSVKSVLALLDFFITDIAFKQKTLSDYPKSENDMEYLEQVRETLRLVKQLTDELNNNTKQTAETLWGIKQLSNKLNDKQSNLR